MRRFGLLRPWWFAAGILALMLGAFVFRYVHLEDRPMHVDEAVHTVKAGAIIEGGFSEYKYDAFEYHGPTLYFFTLPFVELSGAETFKETEVWIYRIVPVVFGTGLILLLFLAADGLGKKECLIAALLTAISPAMVFYGRYYVQEMLLVFFTFGVLACGWRYWNHPRWYWAVAAGVFAGLMHATKETCIIAFGSMAAAMLTVYLFHKIKGQKPGEPEMDHKAVRETWHVVLGIIAATGVSIVFFSSFFTNLIGPVHSLTAYWHYIARSDEGVHQHAWPYYLRILLFAKYGPGPWWSEGVIVVLSVIGAIAGIRSRRGAQRDFVFFLAVYTFCMTLIYTLIPYKTPWCLLSFLHGMILLAGVGAVAIFTFLPGRILKVMAAVLLLLAAAHLGAQAYRASYVYDTDVRNPYVYSHSVRDVVRLAERVDQMAALHPKGRRMLVQVIASNADYWPLPWYLRDYANVGYWNEVPEGPLKAPMVVCSVDLEETVLQRLEGEYQSEYFGLRPHSLLAVFIHKDLWDQFIDKQMQKVGT